MHEREEHAKIAGLFRRSRTLARALLGALCTLAIASACSNGNDLALLPLHGVEIDDDARLLYVSGDGLVHGASCEVELAGTAFPLGESAFPVTLTLPCRVLTGERALVDLNQPAIEERPRGFFEGSLALRLSSGDAQRGVSGSIAPVRLRLGRAGAASVDATLALSHAARAFQSRLGVRAAEATSRGVLLTALDPQGPLALAGGREGDVVLRIDGAPVEETSDLIAVPGLAHATLHVLRRGQGPRDVHVALRHERPLPWSVLAVGFALALVFGMLVPVAPLRQSALPPARSFVALAAVATLAVFGALRAQVFNAPLLWLAPLFVHAAALAYAHGRRTRTSLALARDATDAALATLAIAALLVLAGAVRIPLFRHEGGPLELMRIGTPSGLCALFALSLTLSRREASEPPTLALVRAGAALCAAELLFSASHAPDWLGLGAGLGFRLLACAALCATSALLFTWFGRRASARHPRALSALLAPLSLALALASSRLSALLPDALGSALVLGFGLGLVAARLSANARPVPSRDPSLQPFL